MGHYEDSWMEIYNEVEEKGLRKEFDAQLDKMNKQYEKEREREREKKEILSGAGDRESGNQTCARAMRARILPYKTCMKK